MSLNEMLTKGQNKLTTELHKSPSDVRAKCGDEPRDRYAKFTHKKKKRNRKQKREERPINKFMKENCKGILISNKIYCNNDKLNTYIAFVTLHMVSIHCKKLLSI